MKPQTKASEGAKHTPGKSRLIAGIREIEFIDGLSDKQCNEILDLIAAAPMLLEAVKDMMHDLEIFYSKYRDEQGRQYLVNLKQAIAAAEGRGDR